MQLLERRLDNVIYRLNLATSRAQARQLVTHRHFRVNGRIVNIPSYVVQAGRRDLDLGERSLKSPVFESNLEVAQSRRPPEWLEWNEQDKTAQGAAAPVRASRSTRRSTSS